LLDALIERTHHDKLDSIDVEMMQILAAPHIAIGGVAFALMHFLIRLLIYEIAHGRGYLQA
jgi:hypothetical protein